MTSIEPRVCWLPMMLSVLCVTGCPDVPMDSCQPVLLDLPDIPDVAPSPVGVGLAFGVTDLSLAIEAGGHVVAAKSRDMVLRIDPASGERSVVSHAFSNGVERTDVVGEG